MESSFVRILAVCGICAFATMIALAFGRYFVCALDGALKKWRRLGLVPRMVAVLMITVATVEAQKRGNRELGIGKREEGKFSLTSVKTNDTYSYLMPTNAIRYPNWTLRGAYEDVFKLDFGNWRFPIGTASVSSVRVYTWGKVRPWLKAKELEIAAAGAPMSAVPQFSEFWHSDGTNGSKILTWHNFTVGRIPLSVLNGSHSNCLTQSPQSSLSSSLCVSAQLELFANGDYIARSNLVERFFKRINPDDGDDDGIPDDEDEEPLVNNGDNFGPHQELPEGANSNNYCWV